MWNDAIQLSIQRVTDALLHRSVLPPDTLAFEKVSGAIAVRAAVNLSAGEQNLLFAIPEATASSARYIVASLLIGDHAHANAHNALPLTEVRRLLRGDIVLITQAISATKAKLEDLHIGKGQRLIDIWEVATLSRHTAPKSTKPRVLLANPGWLEKTIGGRRFSAVIIDASHPNTFAQLPELIRKASGCTSLRITVSPPPSEAELAACGYPSKLKVWMWDPQSKCDAEEVVEAADPSPHITADRVLWTCDSDDETAQALEQAYKALSNAAKASGGRGYPGLRQCWSIYNRLRQVAVPLAQLEQVSASTWSGNLRRRIDELATVSGHGNVAWDTTWPQLILAIKTAYDTLLSREETAKFWALASSIETFLASSEPELRVVVGSEAEVALLIPALESVVDGFSQAHAFGRVELVTSGREARLIAEGNFCPTILLAPRTNGHRYLDIFPSSRIDELLYPHEISAECSNQSKLYTTWIPRTTDEVRVQFLALYGFHPIKSSRLQTTVKPPGIVLRRADGHEVSLVTSADISGEIDLDSLANDVGTDLSGGYSPAAHTPIDGAGFPSVEIRFTNGERQQFYESQKVDVYFSATLSIQRRFAREILPGWQVITFVDGQYDGLFNRLTDAVNLRLPQSERAALALWRKAKEHLLSREESKRALFDKLVSKGLTSSYACFISWFGDGEDNVIAPQQFNEFKVLASEIEVYANSSLLMDCAFQAIRHERGRNRALGRTLRKFLRSVVTGCRYEEALAGARSLDAAIADVFAAVEVLEVDSIREIHRS